jgi:hypothetical protein
MGGAKALTADGLFIGQTNEFIELIIDLATDPDRAQRRFGGEPRKIITLARRALVNCYANSQNCDHKFLFSRHSRPADAPATNPTLGV